MIERKKQMLKSKQKASSNTKYVTNLKQSFVQLIKMLMVVVSVYTLSYFPLNIVWVSFTYNVLFRCSGVIFDVLVDIGGFWVLDS